jgi:hypothetical protein
MIRVRFRNFPGEKSYGHFIELVEMATGEKVKLCQNQSSKVELEITGPYGGDSDHYKTPFLKKIKRLGYVSVTNGQHLTKRNLATGIQPTKSAAKNIWYSGENVRPPQGTWDGYLSFDTKLPKDRSVYLPLWYLTSTDLFKSTTESYWGGKTPKISELTEGRTLVAQRKKFAVAFLGRGYSMRMHAVEAISDIGVIDIFGEVARNKVKNPSKIASKYRYVMCFENDLYPGYVTEKPIEAYLSGAIPLYWGLDSRGFLNPKAVINLNDFDGMEKWTNYIDKVENDFYLFKKIYEQPILVKQPDLKEVIGLFRKVLTAQA